MGGDAIGIISTIGSLAGGALSLSSRQDTSAAELARQRAAQEARARAEARRQREEETQEAEAREKARLARMRGLSSTLVTGGAGLLDSAALSRPGLKTRLGE